MSGKGMLDLAHVQPRKHDLYDKVVIFEAGSAIAGRKKWVATATLFAGEGFVTR
jgi:hypothetical protein